MTRIPRLLSDRLDFLHEEVVRRQDDSDHQDWFDRQAVALLKAGAFCGFESQVADRLDELRDLLPE